PRLHPEHGPRGTGGRGTLDRQRLRGLPVGHAVRPPEPGRRGWGRAMSRRVAITGLGPVTAAGLGRDAFWAGLQAGRSFISPLERYDAAKYATRIGGQIADFNPRDFVDTRRLVQTD